MRGLLKRRLCTSCQWTSSRLGKKNEWKVVFNQKVNVPAAPAIFGRSHTGWNGFRYTQLASVLHSLCLATGVRPLNPWLLRHGRSWAFGKRAIKPESDEVRRDKKIKASCAKLKKKNLNLPRIVQFWKRNVKTANLELFAASWRGNVLTINVIPAWCY